LTTALIGAPQNRLIPLTAPTHLFPRGWGAKWLNYLDFQPFPSSCYRTLKSARDTMSSVTPSSPQPPYPIHLSVIDRLDPEYAKFYNEHVIDKQQVHLQPVSASRTSGILIPGSGPKLPVGSTQDILIPRIEAEGSGIPIRVFTPEGERPEKGWPLMVYYHGGGWVLGNIDTENTVCTHLCSRARCVVVTVDYRYFSFPLNYSSETKS
jgi:acetyl esterase/lipase